MLITSADVASGFLKAVLSTVAPSLPLDVIIGYSRYKVHCHRPSSVPVAPSEQAAEVLVHLEQFKAFRDVYMVWEFRLVLCAEVDRFEEDVSPTLERVVEAERVNGGFDLPLV